MKRFSVLLCIMACLPLSAQRMTDTETHSKYIMAVDEYRPAPGQFVNELPVATAEDTPATMAQRCTDVLKANALKVANGQNLENSEGNDDDYDASYLITLGAYGGYITFHFDHSLANIPGQRDLLIWGNSNKSMLTTLDGGGSEPGIVMVSKDVNGNGLPDDPWYELAGSADVDSVGKMDYQYQITYTKDAMRNIPWTDSKGQSGYVYRLGFHQQEYYPLWLPETLAFGGTLLPPNGVDVSGAGVNWVRLFLRYGYVDDHPNDDGDSSHFDFDWAVDENRQPVSIDFVDFVRVYTAVNQACGWMGETSTEIAHVEDLHLDESIAAILEATAAVGSIRAAQPAVCDHYAVDGRRLSSPRHGLNILRMEDGTVKKIYIQ